MQGQWQGEFKLLRTNMSERPSERARAKKKGRANTLRFADLEPGLYVLPLPAGWYQITSVNAPYFDLPHRLDTEAQPVWRFGVQTGRTNYAGRLTISRERSAEYVAIRLHNRLATDIERLRADLGDLLTQAPLASGSGVRDDYFDKLLEASP